MAALWLLPALLLQILQFLSSRQSVYSFLITPVLGEGGTMSFSNEIAASLSTLRLFHMIFELLPVLFVGSGIIDCP